MSAGTREKADLIQALARYANRVGGIEDIEGFVNREMLHIQQICVEVPDFTCDNLTMNFATRQVFVDDREVKLTPTEYNLLFALVQVAGKNCSYSTLLGRVWGPEYSDEREYIHVFIGRLRKEIEKDPANPKFILTVPGVGYKFKKPS